MSECYHCKVDSDFKPRKDIRFKPDEAMIHLCVPCYDTLPMEKILYYCQMLVDTWKGCLLKEDMIKEYDRMIAEEKEIIEKCRRFILADKSIKVDLSMWKKLPMYAAYRWCPRCPTGIEG